MKILYYIHALYVGGAETLITNYLIYLKKANNEVVLVVNNEVDSFLTQKLINNGIRIIPLNKSKYNSFYRYYDFAYRKIIGYSKTWKKIYAEEKPDIVHVHTFCDAFEICDMDPHKVFYTFHSDVGRSLSLGSKNNHKKLCDYARMGINFIALSHSMVVDLKEKIMAKNIFYIPNAIDLKSIRTCKYNKEDFLKKNNLPSDSLVIGHVGRFHKIKNHDKLFSVFKEVYSKCPSARLILVGTGNSKEIEYIEELKKTYNVGDVTLMLGLRDDATAIMSVFDAFVLPSISESFSLVLVEAQAQGVRCITSNAVPPEVICENCVSLDLNESDVVWADAILSDRKNQSSNSIEDFDIEKVIIKLIELYSKTMIESKTDSQNI